MQKVRIIGVPEHFNLPWHLAIEEGAFEERGIDLEWTDIPEGTGKMAQLLKNNETDLAIILSEGIVKSITEDANEAKIVQKFVQSPLLWGIHVGANSSYTKLEELANTKAAISRFGSGSHLMAFVNAKNLGWKTDELNFEVINNLDGAIAALTNGTADYFMWEHFTTKPLVDSNIFRRLGDCPTPWPCFVIAASASFLKEKSNLIAHILEVINTYTVEFKTIPSIDRTLANRYGQKLEDIQQWLSNTRWSQEQLTLTELHKIQDTLLQLNIIEEKLPSGNLLF
ncbi:ABC transporter substrate-binding protein [Croceivirga radicis]|uniref:ABC transporter substrate-binding protein n=1 Tax=Croceivirga radicis TaxID=1929488 RepID=A0A1V6LST1_9FLAO|nr:substrate-binding domain-containing protein [Croceivirga radicis]OQD43243.1 ABC transporter substrate-binding protein [Croceivirga radicis]